MSDFNPGSVENHRARETGVFVYPVYSRRSGGLSLGVNLFPDRKRCSFDCPYCEVFPFSTSIALNLNALEQDLRAAIIEAKREGLILRDISFSGNGEPTMSPQFPEALAAALRIRDEEAPGVPIILITNATGLLREDTFTLLADAAASPGSFTLWLKLDAGTPGWYAKIDRSAVPYDRLIESVKRFVKIAPVTIQTMLCKINGEAPPAEEAEAWTRLASHLAAEKSASGAGVRKFQLYGKARPAPEDPLAERLPAEYLEERARALREALGKSISREIPVEVYV